MKTDITICEYNFEVTETTGRNFVKVYDTSLREYVGNFSTVEKITKEFCEKWLEEYYEF